MKFLAFMNAVSLIRPDRFKGYETQISAEKGLEAIILLRGVSREDVRNGAELIDKPLDEHIAFLISVFQ